METQNLTWAVKQVEGKFLVRKSWKQLKVGAPLVLQVTLLDNQSANSPSACRR